MPNITLESYRKWVQLCADATPGPWETGAGYEQSERGNYVRSSKTGHIVCAEQDQTDCVLRTQDAAFIAASRSALPRLLAHYELGQFEIERLRAALRFYAGASDIVLASDSGDIAREALGDRQQST